MAYKREELICQPKLCLECRVVPNKKCVGNWEELFIEEEKNVYIDKTKCKRFNKL
jgi:hypothetical protein